MLVALPSDHRRETRSRASFFFFRAIHAYPGIHAVVRARDRVGILGYHTNSIVWRVFAGPGALLRHRGTSKPDITVDGARVNLVQDNQDAGEFRCISYFRPGLRKGNNFDTCSFHESVISNRKKTRAARHSLKPTKPWDTFDTKISWLT